MRIIGIQASNVSVALQPIIGPSLSDVDDRKPTLTILVRKPMTEDRSLTRRENQLLVVRGYFV